MLWDIAKKTETTIKIIEMGKYMKAHVLYGINDLRYEEVEMPAPNKDDVLVKVEAVGICGSDIPRIFETGAHKHPLIPGHEFAGTVCKLGENAEADLLGKRVGVFPLIPCRKCGPCLNKQYEMCRNYNYLGSRCDGGFAEYVCVPINNLMELPDNVSFEDAAMLEPTAVSMHAITKMFHGDFWHNTELLKKNVVVIGLGTIGLLLTMNLVAEGFENIYVVGNKNFQYEKAVELSISPDNYCDSRENDVVQWLMSKTNGVGADYVFECVGKNNTFSQAVCMSAPLGKIVVVGNPASDMKVERNIYWKILRNQLEIRGTWNSSFTGEVDDDWHYVVDQIVSGSIMPSKLISHRMNLSELDKGLQIMRDKTEDYVKIMISLKKI